MRARSIVESLVGTASVLGDGRSRLRRFLPVNAIVSSLVSMRRLKAREGGRLMEMSSMGDGDGDDGGGA